MLARSRSLFDGEILGPAVVASFRKLDPRVRLRNPVMFVCEAGALVTLIYTAHDALAGNSKLGFDIAISIWLWFTVVFANLAEAVAEGRGKAQAEFLRRTKTETIANRLVDGTVQAVSATRLRKGDRVRVVAGELIPADGEIVEGAATVDESAITGESAPVIRETGGDRSSVTGGTRVLSDSIVFVVGANPGESFLDRMISLVEGAQRQKTPNEIALSILLAGLTIVFLIASPRWRRSRSTPAPNRASSS
jgi:potassium-transporting ATPase ATP-binding subunit